jgi:hypothetical protein
MADLYFDLFLHSEWKNVPLDRRLQHRWDVTFNTFKIVARDYRDVLIGRRPDHRHRAVLLQITTALLAIEHALNEVKAPLPVEQLEAEDREMWASLVPLVREFEREAGRNRDGQEPATRQAEVKVVADRCKALEEQFHAVLLRTAGGGSGATDQPGGTGSEPEGAAWAPQIVCVSRLEPSA